MSNWLNKCTKDYLVPIYGKLHEPLLQREVLHADETTLQVLHEEGKKPQSKSYMWLAGQEGIPVRRLFFTIINRTGRRNDPWVF